LREVIGTKNSSPFLNYLIVVFSQSTSDGNLFSAVNKDIATISPLLYKPKA
jgi:hypothetical protein